MTEKAITSDTELQIFHKVTSFNSNLRMNAASWRGRWLIIKWSVLLQAVGDGGAWSLKSTRAWEWRQHERKGHNSHFCHQEFQENPLPAVTIMRAVNLTDLLWKVCLVYLLLGAVWLVCVNAGHTAEVLLVQRHLVITPESQPLSVYPHTLVKVKSIKVQQTWEICSKCYKNVNF